MSFLLNDKIKCWQEWITSEKRLSFNTQKSYQRDLFCFLNFLKKYINKPIESNDLECLDSDSITSWFVSRIQSGVTHRSNARALSSIKSFLRFLLKNKLIKFSSILRLKGGKAMMEGAKAVDAYGLMEGHEEEKIISLLRTSFPILYIDR